MKQSPLTTPRLELFPATLEIVQAELEDRHRFGQLIGATIPDKWPPPLNDETTLKWTIGRLTLTPDPNGWSTWYLILNPRGARTAIGVAGFKGSQTDGTVEIGYSVLEQYQRRGYASEAVNRLVAWAFEHPDVRRVIAETYPHIRPSIGVLEKCGFSYTGEGSAFLVIRFELTRDQYVPAGNLTTTQVPHGSHQ